jgi:hypothetical protein
MASVAPLKGATIPFGSSMIDLLAIPIKGKHEILQNRKKI